MKTLQDLVNQWKEENKYKKYFLKNSLQIKLLTEYLQLPIEKFFTRDILSKIRIAQQAKGLQPSTLNSTSAFINSLHNIASDEGLHVPCRAKYTTPHNEVIRYLSHEEADKLMKELPQHVTNMVLFSLHTGLRKSNVINLQWKNVSKDFKHLIIEAKDFKSGKPIGVPLNETASTLLRNLKTAESTSEQFVFTYKGHRILEPNNHTWRQALKRAGIENFRWHDLRHTWASWHIQAGTQLSSLKQLGGWSSFDMVVRYAHIHDQTLVDEANNI